MVISIHAPRTGSDVTLPQHSQRARGISIHAPRTGSDASRTLQMVEHLAFQSTLPARGATRTSTGYVRRDAFQSTLPARGATFVDAQKVADKVISIHAPRTGSDALSSTAFCLRRQDFNPRSPHGERPLYGGQQHRPKHFNPRSPHGERR